MINEQKAFSMEKTKVILGMPGESQKAIEDIRDWSLTVNECLSGVIGGQLRHICDLAEMYLQNKEKK